MFSTVVSRYPCSAKRRSAALKMRSRISLRRRSRRVERKAGAGVLRGAAGFKGRRASILAFLIICDYKSYLGIGQERETRRPAPEGEISLAGRVVLPGDGYGTKYLLREVLRAVLVQRGDQRPRGFRNRYRAMERDVLGVERFSVNSF